MIFDFPVLQFIWWVLVGAVLIIYSTTAGFDFGVTMLMPFMNRHPKFKDNDAERRLILNTIAPTWDGNQTWLVFAGGALFVIWPAVYGAVFSGLYFLMFTILWAFFLRPPGFDYREKLPSQGWRTTWDWALLISAILPVFSFGLIIGNLFLGLPLAYDPILLRSFYLGTFLGLFHPFAVVCGIAAVFMCLMHGTAYLNRRTEADLKEFFQSLQSKFTIMFLIMMTLAGLMLMHIPGYILLAMPSQPTLDPLHNVVAVAPGLWWQSIVLSPFKILPVVLIYLFAILSLSTKRLGSGHLSFWLSGATIAATIILFGATLFPFIVPSSINPAQSLTVWNATSAQYTLMGMFYICLFFLVIIFIYKFWAFSMLWRDKKTLNTKDVAKNSHHFY
jgi:cytochrome d ubiquinol oxidase subunit II